jgi:hypothetical protein
MTGEGPFSTIESAHEFLGILGEQIDEALAEARLELSACTEAQGRRIEAWQLAVYTMTKLSTHVTTSRRLMNDLRTLRNLLHRHTAALSTTAAEDR